MKVLITLGPTHEPIDAVRFITTASSGKMGSALASEALFRGHEVTLVAGPIAVELPKKARTFRARTAKDMISTVLTELAEGYEIFISAAAIADYTPKSVEEGKIRSGIEDLKIELAPNPKLTREVRKKFPDLFILAFKAEYGVSEDELFERGLSKLRGEDLDMVAANDIKADRMGGDYNRVLLIDREGNRSCPSRDRKERIAKSVWDAIEADFRK